MIRQRITEGSILEIPIEGGYYTYAQILIGKLGYAFFDFKTKDKLSNFEILKSKDVIFILMVYNDVITQGHWLKVGKIKVREDLLVQPNKFIYHRDEVPEFELYNPNTGEIRPSTKEECKGLEVAAVYEAQHVEERLNDYFAGRVNAYRQEKLDIFK